MNEHKQLEAYSPLEPEAGRPDGAAEAASVDSQTSGMDGTLSLEETAAAAPSVSESEDSAQAGQQSMMAAMMSSEAPAYTDPKSYLEAPVFYRSTDSESVSLSGGTLDYTAADFTLPGRNGFDLVIARRYSSESADIHEMNTEVYGNGQLRSGRRVNRHNRLQYGLGAGWSFVLPSIETVPITQRDPAHFLYETFLHLEDGRKFEILMNDGNSLRDYPLKDVEVFKESGTLSHAQRSDVTKSYHWIVRYKNGHADYFAEALDVNGLLEHYVLVARRDRFGNTICFDLHPYGGMTVVDSWGRDIVLERTGAELVWTLPGDHNRNPRKITYVTTENGDRLCKVIDPLGRVTTYNYHDPNIYKAISKYVAAEYGDTPDTAYDWMLLSTIRHPSGAETVFQYGAGNAGTPLKLESGYYGGYRQFFPILSREDRAGGKAFNLVRYSYTLAPGSKYIEKASVLRQGGVEEQHIFDTPENKGHLKSRAIYQDGVIQSSTAFTYGVDEAREDYRQLISETMTWYGNEVNGARPTTQKTIARTYSTDKSLNVIGIAETYADDPALDRTTAMQYGSYSILTEKVTQKDANTAVIERSALDASRGSLVVSERRIYEKSGSAETLRERTQYIYGNTENDRYCVVEERGYLGDLQSQYNARQFTYCEADCIHLPVESVIAGIADADGKAADSITERFVYDAFGRVLARTDGLGNTTETEYDALGRAVRTVFPAVDNVRAEKSLVYDDSRNTITTTDENGNRSRVEYTPLGLPESVWLVEAAGDVLIARYEYDEKSRLIAEYQYDGLGVEPVNVRCLTRSRYDAFDRLIEKEIPAVHYYETHCYNDVAADPEDARKCAWHQTTVAGDADAPDVVTAAWSDAAGQLRREYLAGWQMAAYDYDRAGNRISHTDARGNTTTFQFDYAGRPTATTRIENGTAVTAAVEYDALGNKTAATDFLGARTVFAYDKAGRLIRQTMPFDARKAVSKFYYDAAGNLEAQETAVSENEWRRTDYIYDARGRQTSSFAYLDSACNEWQQVCMIYDAVGNKLEVSNGRASYGEPAIWRTVRYAYDRFGNVTAYTDGLEQTEYRNYDATGLLVNKILRDGAKVKYLYDPLGRIIDETAVMPNADSETPVRKTTSYTRTGQKREVVSYEVRTNQAFSRGRFLHTSFAPLAIRCKYDASGRLIEQQDPDKAVKLYEYDAAGNRAVFRLKRNGDTELDLRYTYDNQNRLLTVSAADGSQFAAYTYDANGRRESQQFANGAETIYTYNKGGLLTELVNRNGEDVLSSFSYTYALDGNQLSKTDANGDITEYAYDRLGRLVDETAPDYAISYAYDDWSNRLSLNYQSPNASECYAVDYEYDENNRLLVETKSIGGEEKTSTYYYDANGNLVEKIHDSDDGVISERRSYNGFGHLVCFQKGEKEVWYRYRPDGLRHSKQIIEDSENRVTTHFWDGQNIILESSTNGSTKASYIRGIALIVQIIDDQGFYYLHNGHGDVVQRIDNYGNPLVSYEYDAFGNQLNQCDTDPNPFRYCGEYFDEETCTYYIRARYYDQNIGKWHAEDGAQDGNNWYAYCAENPVKFKDSTGKFIELACYAAAAAAGFLWGGLVSAANGENFWAGAVAGAISGLLGAVQVSANPLYRLVMGCIAGALGEFLGQIFEGTPLDEIDWWAILYNAIAGGLIGLLTGSFGDLMGSDIIGEIAKMMVDATTFSGLLAAFSILYNGLKGTKEQKTQEEALTEPLALIVEPKKSNGPLTNHFGQTTEVADIFPNTSLNVDASTVSPSGNSYYAPVYVPKLNGYKWNDEKGNEYFKPVSTGARTVSKW